MNTTEINTTATNASVTLIPEKVTVVYHSLTRQLIIEASGHEDGIRNISIERVQSPIEPPIFTVVGEYSAAIGYFPYKVRGVFHFPANPHEIVVGSQRYPVQEFCNENVKTLPEALQQSLAENEVIGFSPNSYDVNRAIGDAVSKLQKKFPANVSATVVETGVVAVGSPVGIAYLYVKMRQKTS